MSSHQTIYILSKSLPAVPGNAQYFPGALYKWPRNCSWHHVIYCGTPNRYQQCTACSVGHAAIVSGAEMRRDPQLFNYARSLLRVFVQHDAHINSYPAPSHIMCDAVSVSMLGDDVAQTIVLLYCSCYVCCRVLGFDMLCYSVTAIYCGRDVMPKWASSCSYHFLILLFKFLVGEMWGYVGFRIDLDKVGASPYGIMWPLRTRMCWGQCIAYRIIQMAVAQTGVTIWDAKCSQRAAAKKLRTGRGAGPGPGRGRAGTGAGSRGRGGGGGYRGAFGGRPGEGGGANVFVVRSFVV